jgi:Thioesterase-like superfamily
VPAVFENLSKGEWQPSELAQGPFAGLQGGAVAGLLVAEIEALAAAERLGQVVGVGVTFYRATPLEKIRTVVTRVKVGRRVSFLENVVMRTDGEVCAGVRATLIQEQSVNIPSFDRLIATVDPLTFAQRSGKSAPHGKAWFMDTMDARVGPDGALWFKMNVPIITGAGYFSRVLGAADWCHGINRPSKLGEAVMADPNQDLSVHLVREPTSDWIGIRATTIWQSNGVGLGHGTLCDVSGELGSVSMSVSLVAAR